MILITGIGRSGTKYTALTLKKAGIKVGHEQLFTDGTVCWKHAPFASEFDYVFHQVRNPIDCISSMQTISPESMRYMAKFVQIDMSKPWIHQCMEAWFNWNILCEKHAKYTYRVEEIEKHWDNIFTKFRKGFMTMPFLPKDTHTRKSKYTKLNLNDFKRVDEELTYKILGLAKKYGYDY